MAARGKLTWVEHGPRLVLGAFCLLLLVIALFYRGHSVESLDQRTYAQMVRAVADRGLPYWDNGPFERFPQLIVWWGTPVKGRIWGIYGLLYPYLSAPAFLVGGIEGVSKMTFATLAPLALVSFCLARRVVKSEWLATFAGILSVVSTPVLAKSLEITAYPLLVLMATLGIYFTVTMVEATKTSFARGVLFGLSWAAAMGAHALGFAMLPFAFLVVAAAPDAATGKRSVSLLARRMVPAVVGFLCLSVPISIVNHVRFASYNPVSYGPVPWSGPPKMTIANQVAYSLPVAVLVLAAFVALFVARKRLVVQALIVVAAITIGTLVPTIQDRAAKLALVAFAYIVAPGMIDVGEPYRLASHGIGRVLDGWVAKGTLQETPVFILALLALRGAGDRFWKLLGILLPASGVFLSLVMRANLIEDRGLIDAIGWPWVYQRYACAAFPALIVASIVVFERTRPQKGHLLVAAIVGLGLAVLYASSDVNDGLLSKRIALLIVPLVVAPLAFVTALLHRETNDRGHVAPALAALAIGLGVASGLGHDLRANVEAKIACDNTANRFVKNVPMRFALIGSIGRIDVLLSSLMTHDVRYADVDRIPPLASNRALFDHWRSEGRPIYLAAPSLPTSPWPDVTFASVPEVPEIFLLEFH